MNNSIKEVYLLAGHSSNDPGAIGANDRVESVETIKLRNAVASKLTAMGVQVITDNDRDNLRTVLSKIDAGHEDTIIDLHFDAVNSSKATGTSAFIPTRSTIQERVLAGEIVSGMSQIMGIKNRGVLEEIESNRGSLGVMRENGKNILVEVCFISNPNDMAAYDLNFDKIVDYLANVIKKRM